MINMKNIKCEILDGMHFADSATKREALAGVLRMPQAP